MTSKERRCGTCARHKPFADEFGCDNEDSEAYGLETQWDDWCEEYEGKDI